MKRNLLTVYVLILLLGILQNFAMSEEEKLTLKVGVVPQFTAREIRENWEPILKNLENETNIKFVLTGSANIPMFETQFISGEFDLVYMNPYHMLIANKEQKYVPILKDIDRSLQGILVVKKSSNISSLSALKDNQIVFPAPNALGASLLMRAELQKDHNINIAPIYVKSHSSVYLNVALGQSIAGGGVMKTLKQQAPNIQDSLKIIYRTKKVPPHPIAIHPRVSTEISEKIVNSFIKMGEDKNVQPLLRKIPMKTIGKANLQDYIVLQKLGLEEFYVK